MALACLVLSTALAGQDDGTLIDVDFGDIASTDEVGFYTSEGILIFGAYQETPATLLAIDDVTVATLEEVGDRRFVLVIDTEWCRCIEEIHQLTCECEIPEEADDG